MSVLGLGVLVGLLGISANVVANLRRFRVAPVPAAEPAFVSILIPARDERAGIEIAVRAACAQRGVTVETVVLDDGSTDGTGEILARLGPELAEPPRGHGHGAPAGMGGQVVGVLAARD